jgi:hypothetical protein
VNGKWRGTCFPRHDHPFDRFLLEFSACLFNNKTEKQTGGKRLAGRRCISNLRFELSAVFRKAENLET